MKVTSYGMAALVAVMAMPLHAADTWPGSADGAEPRGYERDAAPRYAPQDGTRAPNRGPVCRDTPERCNENFKVRRDERVSRADVNRDGMLSRDEAQRGMPGLARNFDRIDTNRDGLLSRSELDVIFRRQDERRAQCAANPDECQRRLQARLEQRPRNADRGYAGDAGVSGDRGGYGDRGTYGDRSTYGDRNTYGDRSGDRGAYGSRPAPDAYSR